MNASDFVHLHVHSDYSLIDGAAKVSSLAKAAKKAGHLALALTDHGSLSGSIDFWKACDKEGVKPILGCEAYLAPGLDDAAHTRRGEELDGTVRRDEKTGRKKSFDYDHFTLIAKNEAGWKNLTKLASIASLEGFYYRPRMSWALLTKHREGLIALSGCLGGQLSESIKSGKPEEAEQHARRWKELFGDDYYIELQPPLIDPQGFVNDTCLRIGKKLGIKSVATADIHYVDPSEAAVQEIKICVNNHKTLAENRSNGLNMPPVFYYKSTEEMLSYFSHMPEALLATREIADKCEKIKVMPGKFFLPKFKTPDNSSSVDYFKRLCREGLARRFGTPTAEQVKRLDYEIACIEKLGFVDYFLITQDFTSWARKNGCPVGPGRGCLGGETPIVLSNGLTKSISEVVVGDEVRSHTGAARRVVKTHRYEAEPDEPLVRLSCFYGDGSGFVLTRDHKVLAEKGCRPSGYESWSDSTKSSRRSWLKPSGNLSWIKAGDLSVGDWVFVPMPQTSERRLEDVDLGQFAHAGDDVRDDYVLSPRGTNRPFTFSIRDVHRATGVSRGAVQGIVAGGPPCANNPRQRAALQKVASYVGSRFESIDAWRSWLPSASEVVIKTSRRLKVDHAFLRTLGFWIANGWLRSDSDWVFGLCFNAGAEPKIEEAKAFFAALGLQPAISRSKTQQLVQIVARSRPLVNYWRSIFPEYKQTAATKSFPDFAATLPVDQLRVVLSGYLGCDGSFGSHKITATTVSKRLADQLRHLLLRCGLPSSVREVSRYDERYDVTVTEHVLTVAKDHRLGGDPRLAEYRWTQVDSGFMLQLREVEETSGRSEVFDLTVEGEHTYQTSSFVVHNSAAGSLVSFCLGITNIDPLRYDLLFERFLNPDRVSMPDIDIDFCLAGDTKVVDAGTGEVSTIKELHAQNAQPAVFAVGADYKIQKRSSGGVAQRGVKEVFRLHTSGGRSVTATGDHRFLSGRGWVKLRDLEVGDAIATARSIPVETSSTALPRHELVLLAGILSEGGTTTPPTITLTQKTASQPGSAIMDEYEEAAKAFEKTFTKRYVQNGITKLTINSGSDWRRIKSERPSAAARRALPVPVGTTLREAQRLLVLATVAVFDGDKRKAAKALGTSWAGIYSRITKEDQQVARMKPLRCGAFVWAESLGLIGVPSHSKKAPPVVFKLSNEQLAFFLGRLWSGDGCLANGSAKRPRYSTSSHELAEQVRTLLLRLGITSSIYTGQDYGTETGRRSRYQVGVVGRSSVSRFCQVILPHVLTSAQQKESLLEAAAVDCNHGEAISDPVPAESAWPLIEEGMAACGWSRQRLGRESRINPSRFSSSSENYARSVIASLGSTLESPSLSALGASDVYWDSVKAIEDAGRTEVFDVVDVDRDHNFVLANGLVSHNCERNRWKVIDYVKNKYGEKCVAQIVTFGESKAKSAVRDVARVLEVEPAETNRLAKLIPEGPKVELKDSIETVPEIQKVYSTNPSVRRIFDLALGLEGLYRNAGRHAAGIVIGDTDLVERIPLMKVGSGEEAGVCTAFTMEQVEEVGLLKMDFLGLRTMTVIADALALIEQTTGRRIDSDDIPVRDNKSMLTTAGNHRCKIHETTFAKCRCCDKTLEVFRRAETGGVFQVESTGMRKLLLQMKPDRFDDLVALVALYRPGPLGSGMDQTYVHRKHGLEDVEYEHPSLEPILSETYGLFIYQESVMKLAQVLAGFTLPEADTLRKAIGKKKADVMAKLQEKFLSGCAKVGAVDVAKASGIWASILKFADYCLVGDTEIVDANTGRVATIRELANGLPNGFHVHALGDDLVVRKRRVLDAWSSGVRDVYEVRTRSSKVVKATGDHPFRTDQGWVLVRDLKPGSKLYSIRQTGADGRSGDRHDPSDSVRVDEVVSVAPAGREEVFDLTVETDHNFAVNGGVVVHNCFNKSHSAAYALIAWHTAWLKANYPVEFMAATLTSFAGDTDKLGVYVDELRRMGVPIAPPDVNVSGLGFSVFRDPKTGVSSVLYGLDAVKGVGAEAVLHVLSVRNKVQRFKTPLHFCDEVDLKVVTKGMIESFVKAGAFRSTGVNRGQLMTVREVCYGRGKFVEESGLESIIHQAKLTKKGKNPDQASLFGETSDEAFQEHFAKFTPSEVEWSPEQILEGERESLGFYLSGHPLDKYGETLLKYSSIQSTRIMEIMRSNDPSGVVGGVIRSVRQTQDSSGRDMGFVTIEDYTGLIDGVMFSTSWAKNHEYAKPGVVAFFRGKLDSGRDKPSLQISEVIPFHAAEDVLGHAKAWQVVLTQGAVTQAELDRADRIIRSHPGPQRVYFVWIKPDGSWTTPTPSVHSVSGSEQFRSELARSFAPGHARVNPK